jgi:phosphatidylglycerol lysyltransferase
MKRLVHAEHPRAWALALVAYMVGLHGALLIVSTLIREVLIKRHDATPGSFVVALPLIIGLTLIYLSTLLRRRKRTAWFFTMIVYAFLMLMTVFQVALMAQHRQPAIEWVHVRNVFLPALIVAALWMNEREFTVKSDIRSFTVTLRTVVLVLLVTFIYGVSGFTLMDKHDFHQEITVWGAMQRTVDQFDLTTNTQLTPHTRRAQVFMTSLSVISTGAVLYALLSLFQPLRARFTDQGSARAHAAQLLEKYAASSEDFFKLWPHDKMYFFDSSGRAGLAYSVHRGVALAVGDPIGDVKRFDVLLDDFDELCRTNDWQVAFVHTEPKFQHLYKKHDLSLQKIGEEAVLDLASFFDGVSRNKYFRHIRNKFTKQGFTTELLMPPHDKAMLDRLRLISRAWLAQPGRSERRFMMGYYSTAYMQQCPVMIMRDGHGVIQAFINQVPSPDPHEANFDLLRHSRQTPGNGNDFLLLAFLDHLHEQAVARLNLGLCPLAGMAKSGDEDRSVIDNALQFLYANGDRFYSFSGLYKFKAKYDPTWSGRYIAYRGGIRGFTRTLNALNRAMSIKKYSP